MRNRPSRWFVLSALGLSVFTMAPHMTTADGLSHHFSPGAGDFVWYQYPCSPSPNQNYYPMYRIIATYQNGLVDDIFFHWSSLTLSLGPQASDAWVYRWDTKAKKLVRAFQMGPSFFQAQPNNTYAVGDMKVTRSKTTVAGKAVDKITVDTLNKPKGFRVSVTYSNPPKYEGVFNPDLRRASNHCGLLSGKVSGQIADDMSIWTPAGKITGWNRANVESATKGPNDPHVRAWGQCLKANAMCNAYHSGGRCDFSGQCKPPRGR